MKLIVWMIQKIFRMLNQFAVEIPTLPVDQCHSHLMQFLEECLAVLQECRAAVEGRQAFGTHMVYRETFLQIQLRPLQHLIRRNWIHGVPVPKSRFTHPQWKRVRETNTRSRSEMPVWTVSQKFCHLQWRRLFKELWGQTNNDCRFRISILTNSLHQPRFACWKIRFKTEVCTYSQFPTEAVHWIKEVEMVDSVDDLMSSSSVRGIQMPNFEVLDARIASALNRIIHNSHFKRRISLEEQKAQKEDRFLRGRQIAYLIYDYFRVIGANDSVENYAELFTIGLRNDEIQEFDSKWDGILLSPPDDILEGLYKLRIRESEKLKTILELYDLEIYQKKIGPDYHRLKTMVKRSIEQDIRNENFGPEMEIMKETPWSRIQGRNSVYKEFLEISGNGSPTGSVLEGTIAVSVTILINVEKMTQSNPPPNSFMQQNDRNASRTRSPRGKSPSGRMSRWPCKDYLKGTCTNSFCEKWHPPECLLYKTKSGCRFGEKCSFAQRGRTVMAHHKDIRKELMQLRRCPR